MAEAIAWVLGNFGLSMFILAALMILLHQFIRRGVPESEIIYRWMALFGLGFTGIYTFVMHVFYPEISAATIGWQTSPFQYEVGMADLAIGVLGVLSFRASHGFRLATVIGAIIWLWGDAVGHIIQMVQYNNYAAGNAGTWFWLDVVVPLILLLCLLRMPKEQ